MLGLIGNLSVPELVVVAAGAVLIFGRRLPEVAMRGAAQFMRIRRNVTQAWREAGIEDELRRVRWVLDREAREVARYDQLASPEAAQSVPDYTLAAEEDHEALEREALDHEPGAGHAPSEADEVEAAWADDLSSGPSEEELRAERGKDASGHFEELGTPQDADSVPEPPAIPGVPPHPETGPGVESPERSPEP